MQPPFTHLSYFRLTSRWQADIGLGRKCEPNLSIKRVRTSKFLLSKAIKNLYGKKPCLARFRHGTTGHTMRPQSKTKMFWRCVRNP